jgi:hypothetical protein
LRPLRPRPQTLVHQVKCLRASLLPPASTLRCIAVPSAPPPPPPHHLPQAHVHLVRYLRTSTFALTCSRVAVAWEPLSIQGHENNRTSIFAIQSCRSLWLEFRCRSISSRPTSVRPGACDFHRLSPPNAVRWLCRPRPLTRHVQRATPLTSSYYIHSPGVTLPTHSVSVAGFTGAGAPGAAGLRGRLRHDARAGSWFAAPRLQLAAHTGAGALRVFAPPVA